MQEASCDSDANSWMKLLALQEATALERPEKQQKLEAVRKQIQEHEKCLRRVQYIYNSTQRAKCATTQKDIQNDTEYFQMLLFKAKFVSYNTPIPASAYLKKSIQEYINKLEAESMQNDPRYSHLLVLRARCESHLMPLQGSSHLEGPSTSAEAKKHLFSLNQCCHLCLLTIAYNLLVSKRLLACQQILELQEKHDESMQQQDITHQPDTSLLGSMQQSLRIPDPAGCQQPTESPLPELLASSPGQLDTGPAPAYKRIKLYATVGTQTTTPAVPLTLPQLTLTQSTQTDAPVTDTQQKQNMIAPITECAALDPDILLQEVKEIEAARIAHHVEELHNLPTELGYDLKINAEIDLRSLQQLRTKILRDLRNMEDEKLACSYSSWSTLFAESMVKSITIPLPEDVFRYLREDSSLVLPLEASENTSTSNSSEYEGESSDWTLCDEDVLIQPTFPDFSQSVEKAIQDLGGEVFVKLNWSAPLDAAWITSSQSLKCTGLQDVYLLLKGSELLTEDLAFSAKVSEKQGQFSDKDYCIVLKKWLDINPGNEFRCFVLNHNLIAISQRHFKQHYSYIAQSKFSIIEDLTDFFNERIKETFPLSHYTFDVVRESNRKVILLDFGTLFAEGKTCLFSLEDLYEIEMHQDEVKLNTDAKPIPEFRFLGENPGILPRPYGIPSDIASITSGLNRNSDRGDQTDTSQSSNETL